MRIKWLRLALSDINEIAEFIALDNISAANKVIDHIYRNIKHLKDHPNMGRTGRITGTRELYIPGTPFIVPYRVIDNGIEILRVLHTSRKWPGKL
jgi:addiction module RelE/StbE family toxin